jgi:di/tricarboxylate transporter
MQRLLDVDLILVLAFSIGLGKAIDNSGLAETVAAHISLNAGSLGVLGSLAAIYLLANVLTQLVSNAASATIVYPIAISVAQLSGADPGMYAMTVAFAASLDFSTPIGYQTNLMIYGPGGYKFTDYLRVGVPLNLSLMVIVLGCIGWMYGLF